MRNIEEYKTIVFDCDGVILNSNRIKTEGFEYSVKNFGDEAVKEIKNYHLKNGGVSRIWAQFDFFRPFEYELTPSLIVGSKEDWFVALQLNSSMVLRA